jgi:hypothetical protein
VSTPNDGGAAFPTYYHDILPEIGPHVREAFPGMTLRDYFAAAALQGMMAHQSYQGSFGQIASKAYAVADAMVAKRAKTREVQP